MGLSQANEILGGAVEKLMEGKKVEIEWPDLGAHVKSLSLRDRKKHPDNVKYHKGVSAVKRIDVPAAVKKVMTWKKDMETIDSYHTVIRMIGRAAKWDLVFSAYDLDPGGPKRPNEYRASVFMRKGRTTIIIGEYKSLRAAKNAARDWLIDHAKTHQARTLERISTKYKTL